MAIIAEADEMNEVEISNNDIRVDTYRASELVDNMSIKPTRLLDLHIFRPELLRSAKIIDRNIRIEQRHYHSQSKNL